jgi:predicted nucleic acid-binding protein
MSGAPSILNSGSRIVLLSEWVAGDYPVSAASADPDDDKYLAAALEGRAAHVVTGDPDLLALGEYEGIRIVSPRVFLGLLNG